MTDIISDVNITSSLLAVNVNLLLDICITELWNWENLLIDVDKYSVCIIDINQISHNVI